MPDGSQDLQKLLTELHAQLGEAEQVGEDVQPLLESVLGDIEKVLTARSGGGAEATEDASLVDRLKEAARHFEESHPTLSGTIGSIIDVLGRMGI